MSAALSSSFGFGFLSNRKDSEMLILTRKAGEEITISSTETFHELTHIGPKLKLKVLSVNGTRVKLGFEAPKSIDVRRSELDLKKAS
tara:strand:+ start:1660 stop:1920 length:261 start_codon:yes stop_codon:yes gene_type:complete